MDRADLKRFAHPNPPCYPGGFTLIEVVVVTFIIAVVIGMSLPSFGRLRDVAALRSSARTIVSAVRHARDVAVTRQTTARLAISDDGRSYRLEVLREVENSGAVFVAERNLLGRGLALGPGVQAEIQRTTTGENVRFMEFYSDGSCTGAEITLTHRSGRQLNVLLRGFSGQTTVYAREESAVR